MIVVDVFCRTFAADGTATALRLDHRLDLSGTDAVALEQVVVPSAAVEPLPGGPATHVVTGLAVPAALRSRPGEVLDGLRLPAVRAASVAGRGWGEGTNIPSLGRSAAAVAVARPGTHACPAVGATSVGTLRRRRELVERLDLVAVATALRAQFPTLLTAFLYI